MNYPAFVLPLFLGLLTLLGSGCATYEDDERPAERRTNATLLTLVDESHQLTPEQLEERRRNIVSYLVSEGYIYSGEDLVQSASFADQIIRADLALDGSFQLTIYRPERTSHREVVFDPSGYPEYTYFPGDIGYIGDGYSPYYIPVAPYFDRHHDRDRGPRHRDHDRPGYPDQRPDWNRDRDRPHHGDHDDHPDRPPGTPPGQPHGGKPNDRPDHDHRPGTDRPTTPGQPNPDHPRPPRHGPDGNDPRPPRNPVPPPPVQPDPPPPQNQPTQPDPRRTGPNRQPWNQNPGRPSAPRPATPTPAPAVAPATQPAQPDHRRFRPEIQPQPPAPSARAAPATTPAPNQIRQRPEGAPPRTTPPPARTPPPPRPAPEPKKDQTNTSDSSAQGDQKPLDRRR